MVQDIHRSDAVSMEFRVIKSLVITELRMRTFQYRKYGKLRYFLPYFTQILMFITLFFLFFDASELRSQFSIFPKYSGESLSIIYSTVIIAFSITIPLTFHSYQHFSKQIETILSAPVRERELFAAKIIAIYPEQLGFLFILILVKIRYFTVEINVFIFMLELLVALFFVMVVQILIIWFVVRVLVSQSLLIFSPKVEEFGSKITKTQLIMGLISLTLLFGTVLLVMILDDQVLTCIFGLTPIGWLSVVLFYLITHQEFFPGTLPSFILLGLFVVLLFIYNVKKSCKLLIFSQLKDTRDNKYRRTRKRSRLATILGLPLNNLDRRLLEIVLNEQWRRGGIFQGLMFVLSTIPFIFLINMFHNSRSTFMFFTTLLSNFVAITFFLTILELYNSLSGAKDILWMIKGIPRGVFRFLKLKNLQIILLLSPISVIFSLLLFFLVNTAQSELTLLRLFVFMIGSIITASGASMLAFSLNPVTELVDVVSNPKQTLFITAVQVPFIILIVSAVIVSFSLPFIIAVPFFVIFSIIINEGCVRISARRIERWSGS